MHCTNCGAPIEEGKLFCTNCGQRVEKKASDTSAPLNYCAKCGKEIPEGESLCAECQQEIDRESGFNAGAAPSTMHGDKKPPIVGIACVAAIVAVLVFLLSTGGSITPVRPEPDGETQATQTEAAGQGNSPAPAPVSVTEESANTVAEADDGPRPFRPALPVPSVCQVWRMVQPR